MSINGSFIKNALYSISCASILATALSAQAGPNEPEQTPLFVSKATPPLNMLVMGRDHKLYYEAYNDASDLDGDGVIDVGYKGYLVKDGWTEGTPGSKFKIDYYGYFDSNRCYSYGSNRFNPEDPATDKKCSGQWSGDYLNYLTTSRIDAMRKVLYGGYRSTDTATVTILERSHIPQDAHSWGKEYLSEVHDGYKISDYTPLSQPTSGKRHLFANTTLTNSTHPLLRYITNSDRRIWEWVSIERPVAGSECVNGSTGTRGSCGTITDRRVRVAVCVTGKLEDNCQTYPDGNSKPTGILHDFGEADRMYFGLLTGSYAKNTAGGTLRSNMASFSEEINPNNGRFINNSGYIKNNGIVATINRLRTIEFDGSTYSCGWITTRPINDGECSMWGNPVGEMMYEAMRYFAGASGPHSTYDIGASAKDSTTLSLPQPNWISPYKSQAQGGGGYPACAIPVMTVVSDINPSYDFKLPGSQWSNLSASGTPSIAGLNVSTEVDAIWASEGGGSPNIFIGESGGVADSAPTAKTVSNLSTVRGLAPEEPSKLGTYYSAGVARFGANNKIGGDKEMMTYTVALASPLPKIEFPVGGNMVTVVPFAKSVGGSGISHTSDFQPTNQIVDYYVAQIANTDPQGSDRDNSVNGGRPYAQFRINYEDVEQGADHDMDAIALYTLAVNASGQLDITLKSEYAAGGIHQYMGYAISGTTKDGVYLEICDLKDERANDNTNDKASNCAAQVRYKLNTPPGRDPGWCAIEANRTGSAECNGLPPDASRTFTPSNTPGATLLNNPLWYAAKHGIPNRAPGDVEGDPDNYFLVTNALTLKDQLTSAFNDIMQRNQSVTSPAIKPTTTQSSDSNFFVYRTDYNVETWSGNLIKETIDTNTGNRTAHWNAAAGSVTGRTIKMVNGTSLADFTWGNLTEAQQNALHVHPQTGIVDNAGVQRLGFIKGEHDSFRKRSNRLLGDIINSSPVVVEGAQYLHYLANAIEPSGNYSEFANDVRDRTPLVFVGANDGMLHAFNAETGAEAFAFVPSAVIPNLNRLTSPGYNEEGGEHHFFVDGTPVVRDVYIDNDWRTVLVGTLRAGGRSIFALDITEPNNISLLWELNEGDDLSEAEKVAGKTSDVGYSFPVPTIARLHNGKWAVVTGNGYDSASGRAALFLIDIASGELTKIPTAASDSLNGLSSVRVADNNSDGIADYVYAGDLKGNLWRFDLDPTDSGSSNAYRVSFGGSPLFTALDSENNAQAITAPPSLVRHPSLVGYIVMFGSGRYFQLTDKETDKVDTLYGIWDTQTRLDEVATTTPTLDRRNLQEQTFTTQTVNTWNADNPNLPAVSQNIRILSDTPVTWHGPSASDGKHGWYLDLKVGSNLKGERVVDEMAARGQVLLFTTRTPSVDPCEPGLEGWTYGINPYTGGRTTFNVFDFNKSTTVSAADSYNGTVVSGFETPAGGISLSGDTLFSTDGSSITVDFGASVSGRQSWQIIPEDQ